MKTRTLKLRLIAVAIGGLIAIATASTATAGCLQSNLTGIWTHIGTSHNLFSGYTDATFKCRIKLNSTGNIVGSASSCTYRDYLGKHGMNITGGQLTVSSVCNLSGRIRVCESGSCSIVKFDYGRLSRDKITSAVGAYYEDDPDTVLVMQGFKH